ncbi:MAG: phosphate signaling complex protein PhoU [Firmicutes bacterium]|nr:phosphate signaling complex protein PhoU [Bacillota bacterium]
MRNKFEEELSVLNSELEKMGGLCEDAIAAAVSALILRDMTYAEKAEEIDSEIDQMEREIENLCMKLLLRQQPVARDLRIISAALKMISDMERIGDQASDIAEIVKNAGRKAGDADEISRISENVHIREMTEAAIKMVNDSVASFVDKDIELAKATMLYDDVADDLFDKIKSEITLLIRKNEISGERGLNLLMVAKYLERIGDHAVNIAEWVEYSITGRHKKDYIKRDDNTNFLVPQVD